MAKPPPFVAAKKGSEGAVAAGNTPAGNPFVAGKMAGKGKAPPFGKKGKKKAKKKAKGGFPFK